MVHNRNWILRSLCLVLIGLLLLPSVFTVVSAADTTLVRYRANSASSVIAQMAEGTPLTVLGESGNYYKVDCYNMNGFIAKDQVSGTAAAGYFVRCNQENETACMDYFSFTEALELRSSILELAEKQLGTYYVYGGSSPYGFDCSGFVYYVYGKLGFDLQRCADAQMRDGIAVSQDGLQSGDLVFFRDPGSPWIATHVGIYVGNRQMIHASTSRGITYDSIDSAYFASRYVGARRIVNADTTEITALPSMTTAAVSHSMGIRSVG